MIYVDRNAVQIPAMLLVMADKATSDLMEQIEKLGPQQRPQFNAQINEEFKGYLHRLFHYKCAYCESRLNTYEDANVDLFRPRSLYPWLAYRWENMLIACRSCQKYKGDQFPLKEGQKRATNDKELKFETRMLLNPCDDNPEAHLIFSETGYVGDVSPYGDATIRYLGLNREILVSRRREIRRQALSFCLSLKEPVGSVDFKQKIDNIIAPESEFAAVARAVVRELPRYGRGTETAQKTPPPVAVKGALPPPAPKNEGYIQEIEIRHFRSLQKIHLKFDWAGETSPLPTPPEPPASQPLLDETLEEAPTQTLPETLSQIRWQMLLGENGAGKSSLLQALALAIAGEKALEEEAIADFCLPGHILRKPQKGTRAPAAGLIRLHTSRGSGPIEIRFDNKAKPRFVKGREGMTTFIRAYGATRLLPGKKMPAAATETPGLAIANLFDPWQPLCDVDTWLKRLDVPAFDKVAITLKDVLQVRNSQNIVLYRKNRKTGTRDASSTEVEIGARDARGAEVPISSLSQGQRSTLVLTCDILAGIMHQRQAQGQQAVPERFDDFSSAEGIVLLDEIDAHLHPRWKMEIVPSLKKAFPRIQFICATHEPLCLRGLGPGEIVVMTKVDEQVHADLAQISPKGMRVDQILTSRLFGLDTTIDPELDAIFVEYYDLLTTPEGRRTPEQKSRISVLKQEVQKHNRLGHTRRDQMMYEIIDECLAQEKKEAEPTKRQELRDDTKRKIREMWARVENSMLSQS